MVRTWSKLNDIMQYRGSIGHIGEIYTMNLKIIDVQSSEILHSSSIDYEGTIPGFLSEGIRKMLRVTYRVKVSEGWMNVYCRVDDNYGTVEIPRENSGLTLLDVDPNFLTREITLTGTSGINGGANQGFSGIVEAVTFLLLDYGPTYPKGTEVDIEIKNIDLVYEDE